MIAKVKFFLITSILVLIFSFLQTYPSRASIIPNLSDEDLIKKFAPTLYFHPDEIFRPQPIDTLLSHARLRQDRSGWFDLNILESVAIRDLATYVDDSLFLDIWYGSTGESDYLNYSAHRKFYLENLSPESGGAQPTSYVKLIHDLENQKTIIQYWLFYYYNDWFNKHEGDWEFVQIILDYNLDPEWVILSQHHGGTRRSWDDVQIEDSTHPAVFVALGSHANYFWNDEIYPNGMDIGNTRVEILDRTGKSGRTIPNLILLNAATNPSTQTEDQIDSNWLFFHGLWGESASQSDFGGPLGPAEKGAIWETPYRWGMGQPLDIDVWYQNRFQIHTQSKSPISLLLKNNSILNSSSIDSGKNFLIYHEDLPINTSLIIEIASAHDPITSLILFWPDQSTNNVSQFNFELTTTVTKKLLLEFNSLGEIKLKSQQIEILPSSVSNKNATWNAPDLIWFAGYLPTNQVIAGILISLFAGVLPGLFFVFIVYQVDHYEREPASLLLVTFFWGAIPAILISLIVPIFFKLPPELIGSEAIEAIRTGLFSPLIEEFLKGVIIIFISIRFKNEFDDTLDGVLYGAFVGLGFAITGNTISYLGSFLLRGFSSLGLTIFVQGLLFGLNHAMYSAIFGAGLGFIKKIRQKTKKWLIGILSFVLAAFANGFHGLAMNNFTTSLFWVALLNWIGILTITIIIIWALKRQQQIIITELREETTPEFLQILSSRRNKMNALRLAKKHGGKHAMENLDNQLQLLTKLAFMKNQVKIFPEESLLLKIDAFKDKIARWKLNNKG